LFLFKFFLKKFYYYDSSIFSPSWFLLLFCNFHVLGSIGNNHSHCRITIIPFVENTRFSFFVHNFLWTCLQFLVNKPYYIIFLLLLFSKIWNVKWLKGYYKKGCIMQWNNFKARFFKLKFLLRIYFYF
jgi:hypothetical protein